MERLLGDLNIWDQDPKFGAPVFQDLVLDFHDELSKIFKTYIKSGILPEEYIHYALWSRSGNLKKENSRINDHENRYGRGLSFHIPPKNVPLTAFFSYSFGLLSGNKVCIRLPADANDTLNAGLQILKQVLTNHSSITDRTLFVQYDRNQEWSEKISRISDSRVIWGGDRTVESFRSLSTKPSCVDLFFPDKNAIALVDSEYLVDAGVDELKSVGRMLARDIFTYDQQACSSPRILLLYGRVSSELYEKKLHKLLSIIDESSRAIQSYMYSRHLEYFKGAALLASRTSSTVAYTGTNLYCFWVNSINELKSSMHSPGILALGHINNFHDIKRFSSDNLQTIVYVNGTRTN